MFPSQTSDWDNPRLFIVGPYFLMPDYTLFTPRIKGYDIYKPVDSLHELFFRKEISKHPETVVPEAKQALEKMKQEFQEVFPDYTSTCFIDSEFVLRVMAPNEDEASEIRYFFDEFYHCYLVVIYVRSENNSVAV